MRNRLLVLLFLALALIFSLVGIYLSKDNSNKPSSREINEKLSWYYNEDFINLYHERSQVILNLKVAKTSLAREQGLQGVTELGENEGKLFIFEDEAERVFWMKNTPLSLDIIFLDNNLQVIHITKNAKPNQTEERYFSNGKSKYVIEVKAGWAEKNNLSLYDEFTLP